MSEVTVKGTWMPQNHLRYPTDGWCRNEEVREKVPREYPCTERHRGPDQQETMANSPQQVPSVCPENQDTSMAPRAKSQEN